MGKVAGDAVIDRGFVMVVFVLCAGGGREEVVVGREPISYL